MIQLSVVILYKTRLSYVSIQSSCTFLMTCSRILRCPNRPMEFWWVMGVVEGDPQGMQRKFLLQQRIPYRKSSQRSCVTIWKSRAIVPRCDRRTLKWGYCRHSRLLRNYWRWERNICRSWQYPSHPKYQVNSKYSIQSGASKHKLPKTWVNAVYYHQVPCLLRFLHCGRVDRQRLK
jgi:hypothetical protein